MSPDIFQSVHGNILVNARKYFGVHKNILVWTKIFFVGAEKYFGRCTEIFTCTYICAALAVWRSGLNQAGDLFTLAHTNARHQAGSATKQPRNRLTKYLWLSLIKIRLKNILACSRGGLTGG